jgi:hypothetical protein
MTKISLKSRIDTRGGLRDRRKDLSPYSLLIQALWTKLGGVAEVAKALHEIPQAPQNWKLRGAVPLEKLVRVSTILGISPFALNYLGWSMLVAREDIYNFEAVVTSCELPPDVTNNIIEKYKKLKKSFSKNRVAS